MKYENDFSFLIYLAENFKTKDKRTGINCFLPGHLYFVFCTSLFLFFLLILYFLAENINSTFFSNRTNKNSIPQCNYSICNNHLSTFFQGTYMSTPLLIKFIHAKVQDSHNWKIFSQLLIHVS